MTERPIRFVHRGRIQQVAGVPITRTVLEWLREDAHCTGTKEGCAEGDCGACTVIVAERDAAADGGLTLRPVNACTRLLPTLDGKALLTVEDLHGAAAGTLHPAQQAMVDCHGSQCGFCTPGFVMSLVASYERHLAAGTRPARAELADDMAGNLCRCTGYRPILDAGLGMFDLPAAPVDRSQLAALLARTAGDAPLHYAASNPALPQRMDHYDAPQTLAALCALRAAKPTARLLAGATDVGLWVTKQMRDIGDVIYLGDVAELRRIEQAGGQLRIGAAVTLEDAWTALCTQWPALSELWRRFAGPPVRHAGTLVGNLANGSPIGDGAPVLMSLGATLQLQRGGTVRTLPLDDFYTGYMQNRLEPGELIVSVSVPLPRAAQRVRAYKVSKRYDSDISALCAGFAIELDGDTVRDARFAYGGMAATVCRARGAEAAVQGRLWNEATLQAAMAAIATDYTPLTDLRASAGYRTQVAAALLRRLWLETRPDAPSHAQAVSVWAALPSAADGAIG